MTPPSECAILNRQTQTENALAHHDESSLNVHLADILSGMAPESDIRAENTGVVREGRGLKPDILVAATGRSPVIIEAEYDPAGSVEEEAKQRLGLELEKQTRTVEAVVALRYPKPLEQAGNIKAELQNARLSYCFFQDSGRSGDQPSMNKATRFPETGWIEGSISDLSDLIRMISIPQKEVDRAAEVLRNGIEQAAAVLDSEAEARPGFSAGIAFLLGMEDGKQTRRMACAIVANAMIFHERIAGMHDDEIRIDPLRRVCAGDNPLERLTSAWNNILDYNYFPIFSIANDILDHLPTAGASRILNALRRAASQVESAGILYAHDLTGRIFQRLIADRKYLATFYTRPYSAALLARIAVSKLRGVDWKDRDSIEQLKMADFACGTGALLSAVYDQIAARHERAGGNLDALHPVMMKEVLYGFDVMASAVHITASTLAGARPSVRLQYTQLHSLPYGKVVDDESRELVRLGSLELLTQSSVKPLFNMASPGTRAGGRGDETAENVNVEMEDKSCDLVIMNPPFTRATNHSGAHVNVVNPAFAAFNATKEDMDSMGKRMKKQGSGTCYNGNAGMGSAFAALGDKKLKPGGVLALVLPLTAVSGSSWQKMRQMLASNYIDIDVLCIAAPNLGDVSFSADTGMAECLIIARKMNAPHADKSLSSDARFTSLRRRPQNFAHAAEIARRLEFAKNVRRLEDGPYGGAPVSVGDDREGDMLIAPINADGEGWGAARIDDYSVAQTAYALANSKLHLPGSPKAFDVPLVPLKHIGKRGLIDRDITGPPPRGPFMKGQPSPTATYPSLWGHDAKKETRLICVPDSQLHVRQGLEAKAAKIWATASRCHHNRQHGYTSQPLAVAFTERKTIGGPEWPNVIFEDERFDYVFAIWGNSQLGLLMHWWHGSRQQPGRSRVFFTALESLPTLDIRALSDAQLSLAEEIFNRFRERDFKPAYIADLDPARADLDRAVLCELLGLDESVHVAVRELSAKWAAEPSVRGSKRRPSAPLAV